MASIYYLGITDYIIVAIMLVVSSIIGYKFRLTKARVTTKEYLMAGRNMSTLPVVMSITVTMISAISFLGTPSEVYRFGLQPILMPLSIPIGMALASYVLVPVYFQCGVSTVYEFLEMRFGKITRYVMSFLFIFQMILYMAAALYAPVLALNAVTNLSVELSIFVFGFICSIYCAVGGLKGVLWTDVFQAFLMFITIVAIFTNGFIDSEGVGETFRRAYDGSRLNIFNFGVSFAERFTVWNCILHGIVYGFNCYGTSQVEVQRLLSLNTVERAKKSLLLSSIPVAGVYSLCSLYGLILYAVFYLCDPVRNGEIEKYDQVVAYYLVKSFHSIPGLTGLCVAGIFSGSLSTISSVLNSLASVTVLDFVQPRFPELTEARSVLIAKALSLFYGAMCIAVAFLLMLSNSLMTAGVLLNSIVESPCAAVFTVGVLTRKGSSKNVLFGFLVGFALTSWLAYGSLFSGFSPPPLALGEDCPRVNTTMVTYYHGETITPAESQDDVFPLYKIAYLWMRPLGFIITLISIFVAILLTGWNEEVIPVNSKCLSPVTRYWIKNPHPVENEMENSGQKPKVETDIKYNSATEDNTYI